MTPPATPSTAPEFHASDAVASAELRLAMVTRLANIGMRMAEEIGSRMIDSPYHPEPRHEPGRAFATLSRGIRLTLVLQARVEGEIIALRKGETPPGLCPPKPGSATPEARVLRSVLAASAAARRDADGDPAREGPERTREALTESDDFEAVLSLPFRDCVATICADLGLDPEWSVGSDEGDCAQASADPPPRPRSSARPPGVRPAAPPPKPEPPPIIGGPAPAYRYAPRRPASHLEAGPPSVR